MDHMVIRIISKILFAPLILFAFYVQFHGDFSPGGGFQAGVIFAVALILYALGFGVSEFRRKFPLRILKYFMAMGIFFYVGTGILSVLLGGSFLDYTALVPNSEHHAGQHYGILLVEAGVGMTVASTLLVIFDCFAGRNVDSDKKDLIKDV